MLFPISTMSVLRVEKPIALTSLRKVGHAGFYLNAEETAGRPPIVVHVFYLTVDSNIARRRFAPDQANAGDCGSDSANADTLSDVGRWRLR